jgi:hypothetical protein
MLCSTSQPSPQKWLMSRSNSAAPRTGSIPSRAYPAWPSLDVTEGCRFLLGHEALDLGPHLRQVGVV